MSSQFFDAHIFLTELVHTAGITDPDLVEATLDDLEPTLYDRILVELMTRLTPVAQEQASALLAQADFDGLLAVFQVHIPDLAEQLDIICEAFTDQYLTKMSA